MSQAEKASEPSMEEILASIRKIIAEDPIGSRPQNGPSRANPPPPMRSELPAPAAKVSLPPPTKPALGASRSPAGSAARVDDMLDLIDDGLADRGAPSKAAAESASDGVPSWLFPKPSAGDSAPASDASRPMPELKVPMDNRPYFQQSAPSSIPPAPTAPTAYANGAGAAKPNSIRREQSSSDLGTFVPSRNEQPSTNASMPLSRDPIPSAPERRAPATADTSPPQPEPSILNRAPQRPDDRAPERASATLGPVNGSPAHVARPAPHAESPQPTPMPPPSAAAPNVPHPPKPAAPQAKSSESESLVKQPPTMAPVAAAGPVGPQPAPAASQPAAPKPIADVANPTMRVSQPIDMPRAAPAKTAPSVTASVNIPKPPEATVAATGTVAPAPKPAAAASPPPASVPSVAPAHAGLPEVLGPVRTMEDTVAELLRPMLRQWLDQNMPRIVEKALRVELAESAKKRLPNS